MTVALAKQQLQLCQGRHTQHDIQYAKGTLTTIVQNYMQHDGIIVCWSMNSVSWGRWQDRQIYMADGQGLSEETILEVRIFNDTEEIHLYYRKGQYEGRYITDERETADQYVDSFSRLWGERISGPNEGYATLVDQERFLKLVIPATESCRYYGLVTRNYVTADGETGQAGYGDYRYVAIVPMEGGQ